jgi:hypothetical protein
VNSDRELHLVANNKTSTGLRCAIRTVKGFVAVNSGSQVSEYELNCKVMRTATPASWPKPDEIESHGEPFNMFLLVIHERFVQDVC